jgi:hypothetical protein
MLAFQRLAPAFVAPWRWPVRRIDVLFEIERAINGKQAAERLAIRRECPQAAELEVWRSSSTFLVVKSSASDGLHHNSALAAPRKALPMRRPLEASQYCSIAYQAELQRHGIHISMSGKRNCYDNAMFALPPSRPAGRT